MSRPTPVRHALLLPLYRRRVRISADAVIPGSDAPHNAPSLSRHSNTDISDSNIGISEI